MSEAIFGLLGVVVGALVTFGTERWAERSREKKAGKRASLLLATELNAKADFIRASLDFDKWLADPGEMLTVQVWPEQRDALAISSFKAWEPVDQAFGRIRAIRDIEVAEGAKKDDPIQPPAFRVNIERLHLFIQIAVTALQDHAALEKFDDPEYKRLVAEEKAARRSGSGP